jgi:predicted dinucleotide-binding enzyme
MGTHQPLDRRQLLALSLALGSGLVLPPAAFAADIPSKPFAAFPIPNPIPKTTRPMKIGFIGSGNVGGTLGEIWLKAGHQVMFSARTAAGVKAQTDRLPGARGGTPAEAIAFADVVVIAVPFGVWPDIARDYGAALRDKIVFETTNPSAPRDGEALTAAALAKGTGTAVAEYLPGVKIVRGFNAFGAVSMAREAFRPGAKVGIPLAANDPAAMAVGVRLVRDAGFDPIEVGDLASASRFELRSPAAGVKTAAEIRAVLNMR